MQNLLLIPDVTLRGARVHEASGPAAVTFAAVVCARSDGNIMWIGEARRVEALNPVGLSEFFDPARLLLARTENQTDSLAVAEDALRDGSVPLVVIQITQPLDLREGRRLQLAAKEGQSIGLCLIPESMGSLAAETRWHCAPVFDPTYMAGDSTRMRWEIIKNKSGTLGVWNVRWNAATRRIDVVPPVAQRPGPANTPG